MDVPRPFGETALQGSADEIGPALARLDAILARAAEAAAEAYGVSPAGEHYRGLYTSHEDALRMLGRQPGAPLFAPARGPSQSSSDGSGWSWLAATYGLTAFDLDLLLIALAPHIDLKYERIYGYLQDDVTRRHPTVDLALNLLCSSPAERLARCAHVAPDAPVVRNRLLRLVADPNHVQPSLLSHYLRLDEQIVNLLTGSAAFDTRLASFAELMTPRRRVASAAMPEPLRDALGVLASRVADRVPLHLYFRGDRHAGARAAAESVAAELGAPLVAVDLARAVTCEIEFGECMLLLCRDAVLRGAVLFLAGWDALRPEERVPQQRQLAAAIESAPVLTIVAGAHPWRAVDGRPPGTLDVPFGIPAFAGRRACWQTELDDSGMQLDGRHVDELADRFRLLPCQVADAIATARNRALLRGERTDSPDDEALVRDLFAAARLQTGTELDALARRVEPRHTWAELILPEESRTQLQQLCARVRRRQRVLADWGFARRLGPTIGTNALFAGPPGTGKTMAAEVLANDLGLDLYKIDLSSVVSKYIGETEKNLERIFTAAESANVILFFDEADALFGKRSEVRDSHDRYANVEISYLLQRMEEYDGLAILASNLRQNMDEAFVRRLHFIVEFPFPDEIGRRQIWDVHFPPELPREPDIDSAVLARAFRLAGGSIRSIVLDAAFLAADEDSAVGIRHVIQAARREHQKLGKVAPELTLCVVPERVEA